VNPSWVAVIIDIEGAFLQGNLGNGKEKFQMVLNSGIQAFTTEN